LAALDVGSNTVHLLVATLEPGGLTDRLHAVEMVNLGREVAARGHLGEELVSRTAELVAAMVEFAREEQVEAIGIVATEAIRIAPDSASLVGAVHRLSGENLRILPGEAEARLSYLGATAFRVQSDLPATVTDIGGGSTELTIGRGREIRSQQSLQIGAVRITETYLKSDPPTPEQMRQAAVAVADALNSLAEGSEKLRLIGIGGTATNVSSVALHGSSNIHGAIIFDYSVSRVLDQFVEASLPERRRIPGLEPKRADVIVAGTLILKLLLAHFHLTEFTVSTRGLRYGILIDAAEQGKV